MTQVGEIIAIWKIVNGSVREISREQLGLCRPVFAVVSAVALYRSP